MIVLKFSSLENTLENTIFQLLSFSTKLAQTIFNLATVSFVSFCFVSQQIAVKRLLM